MNCKKSLPNNQQDFFKKKGFDKNSLSFLEKEKSMVARNEPTKSEISAFVADL